MGRQEERRRSWRRWMNPLLAALIVTGVVWSIGNAQPPGTSAPPPKVTTPPLKPLQRPIKGQPPIQLPPPKGTVVQPHSIPMHGKGTPPVEFHGPPTAFHGGPKTLIPGVTVPEPYPMPPELQHVDLLKQSAAEAHAKSAGCIHCHQGAHDMHMKESLHLGCVDCHGGNAKTTVKELAHVMPRFPNVWRTSGNPVRSYTVLNHERPEFIRFVNPGDLRVAHISCGTTNCHPKEVLQVRKSMMTHGCMLWGAALYNNGSIPDKRSRYGEAYSMTGAPLRIQTVPKPTKWEMEKRGVVPFLEPLPRFEMSQPGNILRIFERGGQFRAEIGVPERLETPGRPILSRLSTRGIGTENRTDPVFVGLQKTRLLDPTLNFLGTNDQPGDYRSSGCTGCHVIYANDRSPINSGPYWKFGNRGRSHSKDPTIPKNEPGHPIEHRFAKGNSIPSSQCMVCHMHPGTTVMNSYLGYMWWDLESDGELMYPKKGKKVSSQEAVNIMMANPNEAALRGKWSDPEFLANLTDLNPHLKHNQFADFHGHGWVFRAVYKHDRKGRLLDYHGNVVHDTSAANQKRAINIPLEVRELYKNYEKKSPEQRTKEEMELMKKRHGVPMHLMDIHLEKGMHCIDCHFVQDVHGNTRLQMEVRAAVEIQCIDCHGTVEKVASLRTTGPASYTSTPGKPALGRDLSALRTKNGKRRFEWIGGKLYQRSMVEDDLSWEVKQVKNVIDPSKNDYNEKAALAKTVRFEGNKMVFGDVPEGDPNKCAHSNDNMTCMTCHSSWNPSCYGCHLTQKADLKMPHLHWEGDVTRNYVSYNWQTLRDEVFMLAKDGDAAGNRINPSRSSCAIHVGSYDGNRQSIYVQQQTISGEGFSGISFSTNVPHTVSGKGTTKMCTDCHISKDNDNNAIMAQLLMHGTGYLNFMGRYAWVACKDHGIFSVVVTERKEPQTVIGSSMHKLAFPEEYEEHVKRGYHLEDAHEHPGRDIGDLIFHPFRKSHPVKLQARGEYLYAACGEGGVRVFDIAFIDHKGFSERFATAPVSPAGQRFYVNTKYATDVIAPTTLAPDPTRSHKEENKEGRVPAMYGYIYVTDKYEGLITIGIATLIDGNPLNNFLKRSKTFNPKGVLCGAKQITIAGHYAYICSDVGVVVVDIEDPVNPKVKHIIGEEYVKHPHSTAIQFRYMYVADEEGVKVFDITKMDKPKPVSKIKVPHVHSIYLARTYAYLAAGKLGLVILDIENPERPRVDQVYNAGGKINDLHDVKLGITYTSEFAYLADGKNGFRVVQLTSPDTPGNVGFSPRPTPKLISTFEIPLEGHAYSINRALDRDRAVDEAGNQIAVFGRVGGRPLNLEEQHKMYLRNEKVWKVSDNPKDPRYHKVPYRKYPKKKPKK